MNTSHQNRRRRDLHGHAEGELPQQRRRKHRLQRDQHHPPGNQLAQAHVDRDVAAAGRRQTRTGHRFGRRHPARRVGARGGRWQLPDADRRGLGDTHHGPLRNRILLLEHPERHDRSGRLRRLLGAADDDGDSRSGRLSGYITPSGGWKTVKEVTIAPNYTTHYPVTFNRGGAIEAEFSSTAARNPTNTRETAAGPSPNRSPPTRSSHTTN